jgi:large subunit ribosomal protein L18
MSNFYKKTRSQKVRNKLKKVAFNRYRLSVYRSSKNISAQIIDDKSMKTLVSASSTEKKAFGDKKIKKIDFSILLGEVLAKRAKEKKIEKVYFDRGEYKFHGRIKAFAESLRKNGLIF